MPPQWYWVFFLPFTLTLMVMAFYPVRTLIWWGLNIIFWGIVLIWISRHIYKLMHRYGWLAKRLLVLLLICHVLTFSQLVWVTVYPPANSAFRSNPPCLNMEENRSLYVHWRTGFACVVSGAGLPVAVIERYAGSRILAVRTGEVVPLRG